MFEDLPSMSSYGNKLRQERGKTNLVHLVANILGLVCTNNGEKPIAVQKVASSLMVNKRCTKVLKQSLETMSNWRMHGEWIP
jgi:hypothetical protein